MARVKERVASNRPGPAAPVLASFAVSPCRVPLVAVFRLVGWCGRPGLRSDFGKVIELA